MAKAGEVLKNPITGDRIVFRQVQEDVCEVDFFVAQTQPYTEPHLHALQTEVFEVVSGHGKWQLNGVEYDLQPGDRVEVPAGVGHNNPWRVGDEVLHIRQTNRPGLDFDVYFETAFKAAQRGKSLPNGQLDKLHQAVILNQTRSKSYLTNAPVWLQKALFPILAALGRRKGYQFRYEG
ncbi:MAG TPA: cupin domain-containing protein [Symbiobacteriaceae bacterium]|nr:cupin domain-containing protein [Symbiobacteriaceae bacterium]